VVLTGITSFAKAITSNREALMKGKERKKRRRPKSKNNFSQALEKLSLRATQATGTSTAFILALLVIIVWLVTGPLFKFSDTWQLVINTGTTIVTFLMVFLIQRAQNKDALAIHLKLNEIVAALQGASNRLIDVEDLTESEIKTLHVHYQRLVDMAKSDLELTASHSIEEAEARHNLKHSKHRHLDTVTEK
jgi:low affinity Fe/Cu permease